MHRSRLDALRHIGWLLSVAVLIAADGAFAAAPTAVVFGAQDRQPLAQYVEILRDPAGTLEIADVIERQHDGDFASPTGTASSRGFLDGATWVRFAIHNAGAAALERWLEIGYPFQQSYRVFVVAADGRLQQMESGTMVAADKRPLASRRTLFPLRLDAGEGKVVYLRIAGRGATVLDLTLWEPGALLDYQTLRATLKYLALGASVLVIVFSVLAWRARRRPALLAVGAAHVFAISVGMMLDGLHFALVPADAAHWMGRLPNVALFFGLACHTVFAWEFLSLRRHSRLLSRLVLALAAACALIGLLPLLVPATEWFAQATLVTSLALTVVAIVALRWEREAAARYLAAWGLFWIALLMRTVQLLGWLPGAEFVGDLPFVFLILSTLVLAYALHVDVQNIRDMGEAAQQWLFEMQQGEQTRLMRAVDMRTAELREAKARAEQASEAKSAFLSTMTHELRTPLHTILGYIKLLRRSARRDSDEQLAIVERAGSHLLGLIDEVLEYSRTESRRPALDKRPLRLADLAQHLAGSASLMAADNGNHFELDMADGVPEVVLADEQRLSQVLLNLIRNACTYTENGTVRLRIAPVADEVLRDRASDDDGHWRAVLFEVIDDGCGIDEAQLARIFEPFHRAALASPRPGLGLGLTIASQLVQGMGSEIGVESRRGLGSRFHFRLKLRAIDAPAGSPQEAPELRIVGHEGRRRHLLIVDDIADNRAFLRDLCGSWGFAVSEAADAAAVVDTCCAADAPYDAIVIDQFMPGMDGWSFLRRLREQAATRLPVILLSAAAPQPPADHPPEVGFDYVLIKPLRFDEFARGLRSLLGVEWVEEVVEPMLAAPSPDAA